MQETHQGGLSPTPFVLPAPPYGTWTYRSFVLHRRTTDRLPVWGDTPAVPCEGMALHLFREVRKEKNISLGSWYQESSLTPFQVLLPPPTPPLASEWLTGWPVSQQHQHLLYDPHTCTTANYLLSLTPKTLISDIMLRYIHISLCWVSQYWDFHPTVKGELIWHVQLGRSLLGVDMTLL